MADASGGYGMYLLKGTPVFLWNLLDVKRVRCRGPGSGIHPIEPIGANNGRNGGMGCRSR